MSIKTLKDFENLMIDVDLVIERYNKIFPTLADMSAAEIKKLSKKELDEVAERKRLDREGLAEMAECNKQLFVSYKQGKTPKLIAILYLLKELGGCEFEDFIVPFVEKKEKLTANN